MSGGGFNGGLGRQFEQTQQGLPQNMQPQSQTGGGGAQSWPGQGYGGMPGRHNQGGGQWNRYGGSNRYGTQQGNPNGNRFGPGSFGGYPGSMGFGGGQGMRQPQNPWQQGNPFQVQQPQQQTPFNPWGNPSAIAQLLSGVPQGGYEQQTYQAPEPYKEPVRVKPPWTPKKKGKADRGGGGEGHSKGGRDGGGGSGAGGQGSSGGGGSGHGGAGGTGGPGGY